MFYEKRKGKKTIFLKKKFIFLMKIILKLFYNSSLINAQGHSLIEPLVKCI